MPEKWSSKYIIEFIGVFMIVFFGCGAVFVAIYVGAYKDLTPVMWMWAFAVAIPVYVGAAVSGAHFNPAITLALAAFRGFPWSKVPAYIVSQVAGAFAGAAVLWFAFFRGFAAPFEAANHLVRGQFGSQLSAMPFTCYIPNPAAVGFTPEAYAKVPLYVGFLSEFLATMMLMLMVLALLEDRNSLKPAMSFFPWALGLVIFTLVGLTAPLSMTSLNPARDFGPRLFAYLTGWGQMAIPGPRGEFWILSIGPICGALFGAFVYDKIIAKFFPAPVPPPKVTVEEKKEEKELVHA